MSTEALENKDREETFAEESFSDKFSLFFMKDEEAALFAELGWVLRPEERRFFEKIFDYFQNKTGRGLKVHELELAAGLEEKWVQDFLSILEEVAPQGGGVLVIEAGTISRRIGLAEFVARVPKSLGDRLVLFGKDSVEVKEIAARNGISVVDSDKLSDLAFQLMLLGEEADRVGFLGNPVSAAALSEILPPSMELTPLDPVATLEKLLLYLGYPDAVLDAVNAAGMEELFASARAA